MNDDEMGKCPVCGDYLNYGERFVDGDLYTQDCTCACGFDGQEHCRLVFAYYSDENGEEVGKKFPVYVSDLELLALTIRDGDFGAALEQAEGLVECAAKE